MSAFVLEPALEMFGSAREQCFLVPSTLCGDNDSLAVWCVHKDLFQLFTLKHQPAREKGHRKIQNKSRVERNVVDRFWLLYIA